MSKDELLAEILRLPVEEQRQLRDELDESLENGEALSKMAPGFSAELDRRYQNMMDNPGDEMSWEQACEELDKRKSRSQ